MAEAQNLVLSAANVEIQAASGDNAEPRCTMTAYTGGPMPVAGFGIVVIDLAGLNIEGPLPALVDHDASIDGIVGQFKASKTIDTLTVAGSITPATEAGQKVIKLAKAKYPFQASVGVEPGTREYVRAGESVKVNGRTIVAPAAGLTVIRTGRLREVSIVAIAADVNTSVAIAASSRGKSNMAETATANHDQIQAERDRVTTITALCAGQHAAIQSAAINEGWDTTRTELEILRAEKRANFQATELATLRAGRAQAPQNTIMGNGPPMADVLAASICLSAGLGESFIGKQFNEATMNQAVSLKHRGAGLHDLCFATIEAAGLHAPARRMTTDVYEMAIRASSMLKASGSSTMSVPNVLANVQNKLLLAGYENVDRVWPFICKARPANDFKPLLSVRLTSDGKFDQVAPSGEIHHGQLTDQGFSNQVNTYGKQLGIPRQFVINDDLSAMMTAPLGLGRDCAVKQEETVFTLLLGNAGSFFSSGNGNYQSGSGTALSLDSLQTAETSFLNQKMPNGKPLMVRPRVLLVPTTLTATARRLIRSTTLVGVPASNALAPSANPYFDAYDLRVSPWLNSQSLDGSSSVAWYLFGEINDISALEIAFLRGQNGAPVIEMASPEADFDHLGIRMRAYSDWGVAFQDPRGALLMKGEA